MVFKKELWDVSRVLYVETQKSYYIFGMRHVGGREGLQVVRVQLKEYLASFVFDSFWRQDFEDEVKGYADSFVRVSKILEMERNSAVSLECENFVVKRPV